MEDKPSLIGDLVTDTIPIHATSVAFPVLDNSAKEKVDMLPEESLIPAPTVSDIDGADNEVPVATRRSDPECRSVVDTVFMRLANWTMHWEVDSWCVT